MDDEDGTGHASRSRSLLHMEASQDRVFQSSLKTSRGSMTGGARDTIVKVRRIQAEDGRIDVMDYIGPFYHCFVFSLYYDLRVF
jgi:hypothetical protein